MTTNQTIDGVLVSRELLERIREKLSQTDYTWSVNDPEEELRALLDKPAAPVSPCAIADALESAQWPNTSIGNKVLVAAAITELRKAAQPQGEPVAHLDLEKIQHGGMAYATKMRVNHRQSALYAEQPAPVAVVMPDRLSWSGIAPAHIRNQVKGWNSCLDEVTRLNTK
jgi:hypothetical protein